MNLGLTIRYILLQKGIPEQDIIDNVIVSDNGSGPYIAKWDLAEAQPSQQEIDDAGLLAESFFSNKLNDSLRQEAYRNESDPLFFKWQRGEATEQEWLAKVNEIKSRYV